MYCGVKVATLLMKKKLPDYSSVTLRIKSIENYYYC